MVDDLEKTEIVIGGDLTRLMCPTGGYASTVRAGILEEAGESARLRCGLNGVGGTWGTWKLDFKTFLR